MKTLHLSIVIIVVLLSTLATDTICAQPGRIFFGSQQPQITISENQVNVLWDYVNPDDFLYLITSDDNGTSFGEKIKLNRNATWNMGFGNVIVDGNNVYHVWDTPSTGTQIFFMKSTDHGMSFTEPITVAGNQNTLQQAQIDKFFVSGNNVYVIWSINHFINNQMVGTIFLSKSTDGGLDFDKPIQISEQDIDWMNLRTITSESKIYFVWQSIASQGCAQDNCKIQVHLRWLENNNLSRIYTPVVLENPQQVEISVSGNYMYLTGIGFHTDSLSHVVNGERVNYVNVTAPQWVFFSKSTDGGITFDDPITLSDSRYNCKLGSSGGVCEIGDVYSHASGKNVYVIWTAENYTKNAYEAFFVGSSDNGKTFGKTVQLNPHNLDNIVCTFSIQCVSIKVPQGRDDTVYLLWSANDIYSGSEHAIFAKSTDGGNSFDYTDITNMTKITQQPVLSLGDNAVYLAGTRPGFPEGNHEFFAKSVDGGVTFTNGIDLDMKSATSIPEFSFTIPILFVSFASLIVFYRIKIRK